MINVLGCAVIELDDVVPAMGNTGFGNVSSHLIGVHPRYDGSFSLPILAIH